MQRFQHFFLLDINDIINLMTDFIFLSRSNTPSNTTTIYQLMVPLEEAIRTLVAAMATTDINHTKKFTTMLMDHYQHTFTHDL